jgi:hypothetical protein
MRFAVVGISVAAAACTPIVRSDDAPPPVNACPASPCDAYDAGGGERASCVSGACIAALPAAPDLVVTVVLPETALSGPGRTVVMRLANLEAAASTSVSCTDGPLCVRLPSAFSMSGTYLVPASLVVTQLNSTLLGTPMAPVTLPVHATYETLWPLGATEATSTALAAGLPVPPVEAQASDSPGTSGPFGGPTLSAPTYLLSGANYFRVVAPDPPFDGDFPPDVNIVTQPPTDLPQIRLDDVPPKFDLAGSLGVDGWTTYLRAADTKTIVSPVKTLSGMSTPDGGVLLPTSHHPLAPDGGPGSALDNTELVMAPPADAGLPTEVFSLPLPQETYAALPPPVSPLIGVVQWAGGGKAIGADITFEATAIYAVQPPVSGSTDDAGTNAAAAAAGYQPQPNFEFVAKVRAEPVPSTSLSTYTMPSLPRGVYRVVVRPDDALATMSNGIVHAVTTFDCVDTTDGTQGQGDGGLDAGGLDAGDAGGGLRIFSVPFAQTLQGSATVADGRPLSGASVVATPLGCAAPVVFSCIIPADSDRCLPRAAQATTDSHGSYAINLDPGTYAIHIEPADGTRLPWITKTVSIPAPSVDFVAPAPTLLHLQLADAVGPLVGGAVVRVYSVPVEGPAIEVGLAITDALGRFDMYLDPGLQ